MPYKRNYKREYELYHSKPRQKKNRAKRNAARQKMMKLGRVRKGDGKDVGHLKGVSKGNGLKNLRVQSRRKNRSFDRMSNHAVRRHPR